jgi:hypothetical protein
MGQHGGTFRHHSVRQEICDGNVRRRAPKRCRNCGASVRQPKRGRPKLDLALIPGTYFQPLFYGTTYELPVLVEPRAGSFEVYSGWWYARSPDPSIDRDGALTTEVAVGERWRWTYKVWEIAAGAEDELGPWPDTRGTSDENPP